MLAHLFEDSLLEIDLAPLLRADLLHEPEEELGVHHREIPAEHGVHARSCEAALAGEGAAGWDSHSHDSVPVLPHSATLCRPKTHGSVPRAIF